MRSIDAKDLRQAIEGLLNAKLHDAIARPDGVVRLLANRSTGVASRDIRNAQQILDQSLEMALSNRGRHMLN